MLPTDRQTDGRQHIANVNVSSRSLKIIIKIINRAKNTLKTEHGDLQVDLRQQIYLKLLLVYASEKEKVLDDYKSAKTVYYIHGLCRDRKNVCCFI